MIGILIADLLKNDATLTALVNVNNIFPYVADEDTQLPLVVYTIDDIDPGYNKDGWIGDTVKFSIASFSEDYSTLMDVVAAVRGAVELKHGTNTKRIIVTGQAEGYSEGVFGNKLNFEVDIINN